MSSKQNDKIPQVHPGNYEEFFLLYLDGELSEDQVSQVDVFLLAHPHLRAEFDLLAAARLTPETVSFDKEELLSQHMQLSGLETDLLLYMDQELPPGHKARLEKELAAHPDYRRQLDDLLKTRLDPAQTIAYPNKKELYRKTEKAGLLPWMRIAAAVAVIATAAVLYFRPAASRPGHDLAGVTEKPSIPAAIADRPAASHRIPQTAAVAATGQAAPPEGMTAHRVSPKKIAARTGIAALAATRSKASRQQENKAMNDINRNNTSIAKASSIIHTRMLNASVETLQPDAVVSATINNSPVTSALAKRTNTISPATSEPSRNDVAAAGDRKGSVKGFLRRATKLIEKRTGIDPTNDGELLIGVVAIKLK